MTTTDSEISAAYAAQGRTHLATADPRHRSPVHPDVTVVNADNADLLAELDYRNVGTPQIARAKLLARAESYFRDARTFADMMPKIGFDQAPGLPGAEDCKRYAVMYRTIADELRKVAESL